MRRTNGQNDPADDCQAPRFIEGIYQHVREELGAQASGSSLKPGVRAEMAARHCSEPPEGGCSIFYRSVAPMSSTAYRSSVRPEKSEPTGVGSQLGNSTSSALLDSTEFKLYAFKVLPCTKQYCHAWALCPFAHPGERARRRDVRVYQYAGIACPDMKKNFYCPRGDLCSYAHNDFEFWLHPQRYRTQLCKDGVSCKRHMCFFAHKPEEVRAPTAILSPKPCPLTPRTATTKCKLAGPSPDHGHCPAGEMSRQGSGSSAQQQLKADGSSAGQQAEREGVAAGMALLLQGLGLGAAGEGAAAAAAGGSEAAVQAAAAVEHLAVPVLMKQEVEQAGSVQPHGEVQTEGTPAATAGTVHHARVEKGLGAHGGFLGYQQRRQVLSEGMATGAVACVKGVHDFTTLVHPDNAKLFQLLQQEEEEQQAQKLQPRQAQSLPCRAPPGTQLGAPQRRGRVPVEASALLPSPISVHTAAGVPGVPSFIGPAPVTVAPSTVQMVPRQFEQQPLLVGQGASLQPLQLSQFGGWQAVVLRSGQDAGAGQGYRLLQAEEELLLQQQQQQQVDVKAGGPGGPGISMVLLEDGTIAQGHVYAPAGTAAPCGPASVRGQQSAGMGVSVAFADSSQLQYTTGPPSAQPVQGMRVAQQPARCHQATPHLQVMQQQQQQLGTSMELVQPSAMWLLQHQQQQLQESQPQQLQPQQLHYQVLASQLPVQVQEPVYLMQQQQQHQLLQHVQDSVLLPMVLSEEPHDRVAYSPASAAVDVLLQQVYLDGNGPHGGQFG